MERRRHANIELDSGQHNEQHAQTVLSQMLKLSFLDAGRWWREDWCCRRYCSRAVPSIIINLSSSWILFMTEQSHSFISTQLLNTIQTNPAFILLLFIVVFVGLTVKLLPLPSLLLSSAKEFIKKQLYILSGTKKRFVLFGPWFFSWQRLLRTVIKLSNNADC